MTRGGALAILLVFTLFGPIFAALIFGSGLTAWSALFHPEDETGLMLLAGVLAFLPIAYLTVGLQSIGTGMVAAAAALWRGRLEWWPALGASALLGGFQAARAGEDASMLAIFLASHVGAAALCLLVCRLMLGRPGPA